MTDVEFAMRVQTEAAKSLLMNLRAVGEAGDADLVADAIEGETGLTEAIEAALVEIDECEALAIGLKAKEEQFSSRRATIEKRAERIRAAIEQAMVSADLSTLRLATGTLSLSRRAPGLVVTNEADIPARFWTAQEPPAPKLDRKALQAALAAKETILGAGLDNGSVSLTVRRK